MKTIATFCLLTGVFCFWNADGCTVRRTRDCAAMESQRGAVVEKMIVRYEGTITRMINQINRGPWVVFYRDMSGDSRVDRVELRMWRLDRGFSLPVMVFMDNDLDGLCDGLYACDLDGMTVGEVWAAKTLTLRLSGTDAVGMDMREVHPLMASVEPLVGC